ncbi:substrate-binding periplasmic protein [Pseudogulbenkiania subflava]|uniref:Amino acid ABC transporter substrate-binding protein, PAAT family (TC 3.A.1.3.-) n=1 Tax=Pseudogulbenkiania subflava DSM 22618 TaxID=1123014 RepID=A0A1Y6BZE2_9NEIS|nr:transporter substrate-binding domain-containing protein [Pseudogulbenkiania subflava]SMF37375.1 amino acid ABC transporter substrate-binding protein, PAAT family (TC 3.A.1.3.-) [Pseudogulbenkiania subflava DSM 22618]
MNRRHVLTALLVAPLLLVQQARAANLDDIRAGGVLRVAVYRDFPPFSFVKDGELTGIDVDLARAIGKKLGLAINFMPITPADDVDGDLRNAVWKGHYLGGGTADLMLHVPFDRELARRNDNAYLFSPYYSENFAWAGGNVPGSTLQIGQDSIAVENDSLADLYLSSLQGGRLRSQLQHYPSAQGAVAALREDKASAVYGTQSELEWGLPRGEWRLGQPQAPGLIKARWEVGMATKESLRDLAWAVSDAVTELRQSGKLARLFARYQVSYRAPDEH